MKTNILARTAVAVTAAAIATTITAGAATTRLVKYNAGSMTVARNASGWCWTSSIASTRTDAYRCMAGNEIYDPCFTRGTSSVVCPENLVNNSGLALKLTKPLPPPASPLAAQPWAMVLAGRKTCNRGTGTIDPNYPFYCQGIEGACSSPNRSTSGKELFAACSATPEAKTKKLSHWVVTAVYE
ncbi:MAG: hypothetical protein JO092_09140 [Candidatus Eremiobacteraeota bacterium]|nr:hypothetical protein [Candidatus Eremiobacteraeota bacterium]